MQKGDWTVVVMNADGSPGILADVKVGAKVGFLGWAGIGLLAAGALLAALAAVLFLRSGGSGPRPARADGLGGHVARVGGLTHTVRAAAGCPHRTPARAWPRSR